MFFCCPFLGSALVFVEKQEKADMLFKDLLKTSYPCLSLHGGKIRSSHPCIVFISSPVPTVPEKKLNGVSSFGCEERGNFLTNQEALCLPFVITA